jgi:hypothetical protein
MPSFEIDQLIPSAWFLDPGSLEHITREYSNEKNFKSIEEEDGPIYIQRVGDLLLVTGGNHRVSWTLLNGRTSVEAEWDCFNHGQAHYNNIIAKIRDKNVYNFNDLVAKIQNPETYIVSP